MAMDRQDQSGLEVARAWLDALNRRDADALDRLMAPDGVYWGMVRTPPEAKVRWGKDQFVAAVRQRTGDMRRPVTMTETFAFGAADHAVIEAEGYGERPDGGVYANGYCLVFSVREGQVTAVRDYCCTVTAQAHFAALKPIG